MNLLALSSLLQGYQQGEKERLARAKAQQELDEDPLRQQMLKAQIAHLNRQTSGLGASQGLAARKYADERQYLDALGKALPAQPAAPKGPDFFSQPGEMVPQAGPAMPGAAASAPLPAAPPMPGPQAPASQYFMQGPGAAPMPTAPQAGPLSFLDRLNAALENPNLPPHVKAQLFSSGLGQKAEAAQAQADARAAALDLRQQQLDNLMRHQGVTEASAQAQADARAAALGLRQQQLDNLMRHQGVTEARGGTRDEEMMRHHRATEDVAGRRIGLAEASAQERQQFHAAMEAARQRGTDLNFLSRLEASAVTDFPGAMQQLRDYQASRGAPSQPPATPQQQPQMPFRSQIQGETGAQPVITEQSPDYRQKMMEWATSLPDGSTAKGPDGNTWRKSIKNGKLVLEPVED